VVLVARGGWNVLVVDPLDATAPNRFKTFRRLTPPPVNGIGHKNRQKYVFRDLLVRTIMSEYPHAVSALSA
jgi:hypothetical protein